MDIFVKKIYIITIDGRKWLYELRTLRDIIFNLAFIACCASITGCAGIITSDVTTEIEDVYVPLDVHSVQSASIVGGDLKVCISASNQREKEPINYTLHIPYEKLALWHKQKKAKNPDWNSIDIAWSGPPTNIDYQPCEASLTEKQVKVLNIVQLEDLHDWNYLGWYLNEGIEKTEGSRKERANKVKYKRQALMLDDIVESGIIENETVAVISEFTIGGDRKYNPSVKLYYFDPVLRYANTSYVAFDPPKKYVQGNKALNMLLPVTYLFDAITFPLQMWMLVNSGH